MTFDAKELLAKMQPNQKINYDSLLQKLIKEWKKAETKPRILLHSCCAPCSTYTLEYLTKYAEVDVYYANSNIHPRVEYERRAIVQKEFIEKFNQDYNQEVGFILAPYEPSKWIKMVAEQNIQDAKEGGERCAACFDYRLDQVANKAQSDGYDYFASALTISPHKNSQLINQIGFDVQMMYDARYLPSDFKKNNGYKRSVEMCDIYDIYRQCYCGCVYAAKQQGVDFKQVTKSAKEYVSQNSHKIDWTIHQTRL